MQMLKKLIKKNNRDASISIIKILQIIELQISFLFHVYKMW